MSASGYDDAPPSYEPDQTSGDMMSNQYNNDNPSAPPNYNDLDNLDNDKPPLTDDEGVNTNDPFIPKQPAVHLASSLSQRSIYIVKMPNEPVPLITVITPDLIPQYQTEHIVYPKSKQGTSQIQVIKPIIARTALRTKVNTASQPLSVLSTKTWDSPPSSVNHNRNNNNNIYKRVKAVQPTNTSNRNNGTMVAHHGDANSLNLCGGSDVINRDKRTPSDIPHKYNLMYGRINLLTILYLWVLFIMIRLNSGKMAQMIAYCYNEYPDTQVSWSCGVSNDDYIGCVADPICSIVDDPYWDEDGACFDDYSDCQCCVDTAITGGQEVYIAFYVFLGINTFRLLFWTFGFGMESLNKVDPGLYVTDSSTNKVLLKEYMNYLCDHPASYILGVFYSDASRAMTEGIVYNIAFPLTKFLYLNIMLLYVPFFVLISLITQSQMRMLSALNMEDGTVYPPTTPPPTNIYGYAAPTMDPTTPAPTISTTPAPTYSWQTTTTTKPPNSYEVSADLLITCIVGLALLSIGLILHIHRWKRKNKIERMNLKQKAASEGKEIVVGNSDRDLNVTARIPSDVPHKLNLMYSWINTVIWIYLWVLFTIGKVNYGWFVGDYGACIAYLVFLGLHTLNLMVSLVAAITNVDNEYNYIVNSNTGKVQQRVFMDYACDTAGGLIVGFLYEDAGRALQEAVIYNMTFPTTSTIFTNILLFDLPMMIMCAYQAAHPYMNAEMWLWYTIGACMCSIGILSNGYRFKMKNDAEISSSNTSVEMN
eukprot:34697_1